MVDIDDADGKPKLKASSKSKLLPSNASSPYIGIPPPSHRHKAGCHRLNEDKGDAPKAKHHKRSTFDEPNISEGKWAYADPVNNLEKAASDSLVRSETYLQAVNGANKSLLGSFQRYLSCSNSCTTNMLSCSRISGLELCRGSIKITCGIGMTNLGLTVTTVTMTTVNTAPLQVKPPEMHLKEWKNISVVQSGNLGGQVSSLGASKGD
jgi:hypothetical protein